METIFECKAMETKAAGDVLRAFFNVVRLQRYDSVVIQWDGRERWYPIGKEGNWPLNSATYVFFKQAQDLCWVPDLKLLYL